LADGYVGPNLQGISQARGNRISGLSVPNLHDSFVPNAFHCAGFTPLMPQFNDEPTETNYMPENDLQAIIAFLMTQ